MKIDDVMWARDDRCTKPMFAADWIGERENEVHPWVSNVAVTISNRRGGIMLGGLQCEIEEEVDLGLV